MGEDNLFTYITVDDLGEPSLPYTPMWSSSHYISPTQHFYNDLCSIDVTSINEITEDPWKSYRDFLKREKKKEEKRKLIEDFYELTKILEKDYKYSIPF